MYYVISIGLGSGRVVSLGLLSSIPSSELSATGHLESPGKGILRHFYLMLLLFNLLGKN
jgi:hypothetical protein